MEELEDKIFSLEVENFLLKRQLRKKESELQTAINLINSYYEQDKHDLNKYLSKVKVNVNLSDGAKQFVKDIAEENIWKIYKLIFCS